MADVADMAATAALVFAALLVVVVGPGRSAVRRWRIRRWVYAQRPSTPPSTLSNIRARGRLHAENSSARRADLSFPQHRQGVTCVVFHAMPVPVTSPIPEARPTNIGSPQ